MSKYCEGCDHMSNMRYGGITCNYLLDTGKRRPCKAGNGCTEHTGTLRVQDERDSFDTAVAFRLFDEGMSDEEIGNAVNRSKWTIQEWRLKNGLRRRNWKGNRR